MQRDAEGLLQLRVDRTCIIANIMRSIRVGRTVKSEENVDVVARVENIAN